MLPLCDAWNALFLGFRPQASVPVGVYVATLRCLGCILPWVWATGLGACRCICCHLAMPGMRNWKITKNACKLFPYPAVDRGGKKFHALFCSSTWGGQSQDMMKPCAGYFERYRGWKQKTQTEAVTRPGPRASLRWPRLGNCLNYNAKDKPRGEQGGGRAQPSRPSPHPFKILKAQTV